MGCPILVETGSIRCSSDPRRRSDTEYTNDKYRHLWIGVVSTMKVVAFVLETVGMVVFAVLLLS